MLRNESYPVSKTRASGKSANNRCDTLLDGGRFDKTREQSPCGSKQKDNDILFRNVLANHMITPFLHRDRHRDGVLSLPGEYL